MVVETEDVAIPSTNEPDAVTARYLHKLATHAKKQNLPSSLVAHYETQSWIALRTDIKYSSCKKCRMPPPPPFEINKQQESSTLCSTCGYVNKHKISVIQADVPSVTTKTVEKRPEVAKRPEESMKRKMTPNKKSQSQTPQNSTAKKSTILEGLLTPYTPEAPAPPLLLQSSRSKKRGKKVKVTTTEEPDFLQKLFGIGATPS